MTTDVELATRPSTSFADDDLHRMLEFDRIVKLSDSITSGKHARIKIPPHLAPSSTSTASPRPSAPAERRPSRSTYAAIAVARAAQLAKGGGAAGVHLGDNLGAFGENNQLSARTAAASSLPGLGFAPREQPVSHSNISPSEIPSQRARIEAVLREQASRLNKTTSDGGQVDFIVNDVLRRARELERTFTPPPVPIMSNDDITNLGRASVRPRTKAASSAAADSVDDQTFYSSNFSTPEFALTSRIPAEFDNDDVSMHDSSDYEPELDTVPSPKLPSHQSAVTELQQLPQQLAPTISRISNQTPAEILASLLGQNFDPNSLSRPLPSQTSIYQNNTQLQQPSAVALSSWEGRLSGLSGGPQSVGSGQGSSGESAHRPRVAAGNPKPSSPFVRTHNLSPIAPQPAHISSLAVTAQLPLATEEQQIVSQGTPAQVAMLRRGDASQSSPDTSPVVGGRAADKKKGKKKAIGKRKADLNPGSPRIKLEPRSPSPILAPPATQRPHKRQRQDGRAVREVVYRYDDGYSPTSQTAPYAPARATRDERAPIIYERVDRGGYARPREVAATRRASLQRYDEQRNYEGGYEQVLPGYAPQQPGRHYSARPPSAQYPPPPSQANLRPARAATHALLETSSGYPIQHGRPEYAAGEFEASGRMSARPMAMAPPPTRLQHISSPAGRIVVDEFDREYYEPAMPDPRQQQTVVETVAYDSNLAYERSVSHQHYSAPGPVQRYGGHIGSQAPPAGYDEDEIVYQRTSPVFVAPRRVVTQPEYVTREYAGYPQREFSTRPSQYPVAAAVPPEREFVLDEAAPPRGYLARASTARPSEAARYEAPPGPLPGRYLERVGSVRPPDSTAAYQAGHGFAAAPPNGPRAYDGRVRGVPEGGVYSDDHRGEHEVIREYSARPEPHVVVQRAYSARPRPAPAYYAEQVPYMTGGQPAREYDYPDDREVYR